MKAGDGDVLSSQKLTITPIQAGYQALFFAMGSPCEIQIRSVLPPERSRQLLVDCYHEASRIEKKYSRYRCDNLVSQMNSATRVQVDEETHRLLDYADHCYRASSGLFDITSGVLRRFWRFDGNSTTLEPDESAIQDVLSCIGWDRVYWEAPWFQLPPQMEIDFGGIAKEYAVDRVALYLKDRDLDQILVNFGGDLAVYTSDSQRYEPWTVGIEQPHAHGQAAQSVSLYNGALATSGSTHRYCRINDRIYGHILNPKTGYPVEDAPLSVTTFSDTCTQAGMLSTFAMLHGRAAEPFLQAQQVPSWVIRP